MNLQQQATAALSRMRYCQLRKLKHSEHHHEAVKLVARVIALELRKSGVRVPRHVMTALGAVKAKQMRLV